MINADVESMFEYIPVGTPVWIGSDGKLGEFGIKQYYTVVEKSDMPPYTPAPELDETPIRDASRAEPTPLYDSGE
jgi:hypothetical protein